MLSALAAGLACRQKDGAPRPGSSVTPVASVAVAASAAGSAPAAPVATDSTACAELRALACEELGPDSGVCDLLGSDAAKLPDARCRTMLEQRTQTLADFHQLEASRLPLSGAAWQSLTAQGTPALGPDHAPVTVVAFLDFDCAPCVPAAKLLPLLVSRYPGKVRVVFRQHPLARSARGEELAQASLAAHEQGKYAPYYDCIYNNQHDLEHGVLERCARESGLNVEAVTRAAQSKRFAAALERDYALGQKSLVGGAPYFFVNGKRLAGTTDTQALEALVAAALP